MKKQLFELVLVFLLIAVPAKAANFPHYFEIDVGQTVTIDGFPPITLLDKKVTVFDQKLNRIGAAEATLRVGDKEIVVPVGYENDDVIVGDVRLGVEVISDYEHEFTNKRFHLTRDARLRLARAGEPLMPAGTHAYPFFTPWNNGTRNQGWLTVCYSIKSIEGKTLKPQRYHDGFDFGAWQGQPVRSVCRGTVVSPKSFPELLKNGILSDRNYGPVGGNPFLIKHPNLPLLYYYTHLSGLAKDFKAGDIIEAGEIIGFASARGSSGGWYHLHFSMLLIDKQIHINPYPFLAQWYKETMPHYMDFITDFEVYYFKGDPNNKDTYEKNVVAGKVKPTGKFHNSLPGVVHLREAVAKAPHSGLNHVIFDQFAILKGRFNVPQQKEGELWLGHTGRCRVYLNGQRVYSGENKNPYHRSVQPLQADSQTIRCRFKKGTNEVLVAVDQTNVFWSFSIRPRTRLELPIQNPK